MSWPCHGRMMWGLLGVMLSTSDILATSVKLHAKLWWPQTKRLQLRQCHTAPVVDGTLSPLSPPTPADHAIARSGVCALIPHGTWHVCSLQLGTLLYYQAAHTGTAPHSDQHYKLCVARQHLSSLCAPPDPWRSMYCTGRWIDAPSDTRVRVRETDGWMMYSMDA